MKRHDTAPEIAIKPRRVRPFCYRSPVRTPKSIQAAGSSRADWLGTQSAIGEAVGQTCRLGGSDRRYKRTTRTDGRTTRADRRTGKELVEGQVVSAGYWHHQWSSTQPLTPASVLLKPDRLPPLYIGPPLHNRPQGDDSCSTTPGRPSRRWAP